MNTGGLSLRRCEVDVPVFSLTAFLRQFLLAAALLLSLPALAADPASITALRSWRAPDNTRLVLDLSAPGGIGARQHEALPRYLLRLNLELVKRRRAKLRQPNDHSARGSQPQIRARNRLQRSRPGNASILGSTGNVERRKLRGADRLEAGRGDGKGR